VSDGALRLFSVIQGHQNCYQSKAHKRLCMILWACLHVVLACGGTDRRTDKQTMPTSRS